MDSESGNLEEGKVELEHHKQRNLCTTRAAYRQGRKLTAVKTYTVNSESIYLLIFGVPKINLRPELKNLCQKYGEINNLTYCDQYPTEDFTECFRVKYERIQSARIAKRMIDTKNFFGGSLHVCYAPEFETLDETRAKLMQRRVDVAKRLQMNKRDEMKAINDVKAAQNNGSVIDSESNKATVDCNESFIGSRSDLNVNNEKFVGFNIGFNVKDQSVNSRSGFNVNDQSYVGSSSGFNVNDRGYVGSSSGFNVNDQGYVGSSSGFNVNNQGYVGSGNGFNVNYQGYVGSSSGFNVNYQGYVGSSSGFNVNNQGYVGSSSGFNVNDQCYVGSSSDINVNNETHIGSTSSLNVNKDSCANSHMKNGNLIASGSGFNTNLDINTSKKAIPKPDYVFKHKAKKRSKNLDREIQKIKMGVREIGPVQNAEDVNKKDIEAVNGRIVVCEQIETPRIVKIKHKPMNKIVFNINNNNNNQKL